MSNFYTLLGCKENSSYEEIKKCYQDLVRISHPDKIASSKNGQSFIEITEAWNTLRDPNKRKAYDAQLLAEQCKSEHILYATLMQSELNVEGDTYTYPCRCGSIYSILIEDCTNANMDLYCQCSECSLGVLIKAVTGS